MLPQSGPLTILGTGRKIGPALDNFVFFKLGTSSQMFKSMSLQCDTIDDCMDSLKECNDLDAEEEADMEMDLFDEG